MELKKVFAGILSAVVLSFSTVPAFAASTEEFKTIPMSSEGNKAKQPYFNSFTGTVKKMSDFKGVKGSKIVLVENEEGKEANIILSDDTYIANDEKITEGSVITGFYNANAPMLMIYPPQYNAEVVVVNKDENIKVDIFDKDLISSDQSLKLNISDDTEIILQDGKAFKGELANRKLVVTYGVSTRSIPAQTTPTKIVVLFEKAVPVPGNTFEMDKVNDDKKAKTPVSYTNEKGTVVVLPRTIVEALGIDVK